MSASGNGDAPRHWTDMTRAAFADLPSRLDHKDYREGVVYRDPENPGTVFLYLGPDDWRQGFLSGRPGLARNDRWCAREVSFLDP